MTMANTAGPSRNLALFFTNITLTLLMKQPQPPKVVAG
jgi:hypothetical protein